MIVFANDLVICNYLLTYIFKSSGLNLRDGQVTNILDSKKRRRQPFRCFLVTTLGIAVVRTVKFNSFSYLKRCFEDSFVDLFIS